MGGNTGALGPAITGVLTYGLGSGVAYQNGSILSHPDRGNLGDHERPDPERVDRSRLLQRTPRLAHRTPDLRRRRCTQTFQGGTVSG